MVGAGRAAPAVSALAVTIQSYVQFDDTQLHFFGRRSINRTSVVTAAASFGPRATRGKACSGGLPPIGFPSFLTEGKGSRNQRGAIVDQVSSALARQSLRSPETPLLLLRNVDVGARPCAAHC